MGIFGKLFASDKAVDNILDKDNGLLAKAGAWVGNMSYTEEEKAENGLLVKKWGLKQLDALEPFKVVQRILAFSISLMWVIVGINVLVAIWVEAATGLAVKRDMMEFAMSDYVFWPVVSVLSLYFSGGVINTLRSRG